MRSIRIRGSIIMNKITEFKLLWHVDYWDGPMSGAAMLPTGERVWFVFDAEQWNDDERTRIFKVFRLTPEQWAVEDERHADFQKYVGYALRLHRWSFALQ